MPKALRIAIEGNIGIGKSTLLPRLQDALGAGWSSLSERVDEDPEFKALLEAFYKDANKQVDLQSFITQRRLREFRKLADDPQHYLFERSFFGELIFTHANLQSHALPPEALRGFYSNILSALKECRYDALIYLKAPPETCYERIRRRARDAESCIAYDYVDYVHKCYEAHLAEAARQFGTPVLTFNWADFGSVEGVARDLREVTGLQQKAAA